VFMGRSTPASTVATLQEQQRRGPDTKPTASRQAASTHTGSTGARARSMRMGWAIAAIAVVLLGAVLTLGRSGRDAGSARPVAAVASLPSIPAALPSALPAGAPLPAGSEPPSPDPEPTRGAPPTSAQHSHGHHRRERESAAERAAHEAPSERAPATAPAERTVGTTTDRAPPPSTPAARPLAATAATSAGSLPPKRSATSGETAAQKAGAISPDLQQRIDQIRAASSSRVETAVGLYQAAAGRFGSSSALHAVRAYLSRAGEKRIFELLHAGRCAQAQALFRALRATGAAVQPSSSFGGACPKP
jgi:hypothetical protein